jgi:hypothetical protein
VELSGSLHPITKLAFIDELEKISREVSPQGQANRDKAKKFLKSTAIITAGSAAGVGTFMVGDMLAKKLFGAGWNSMPKDVRHMILTAAGGAAAVGSAHYVKRLAEEREKYMKA